MTGSHFTGFRANHSGLVKVEDNPKDKHEKKLDEKFYGIFKDKVKKQS